MELERKMSPERCFLSFLFLKVGESGSGSYPAAPSPSHSFDKHLLNRNE